MPVSPLCRAALPVFVAFLTVALLAMRPPGESPLDRLLAKLQAYSQAYPYEKVYLHTDRTTYLAGETVWLKSYLFYGESKATDSTSGSVLVDLVSPNGRRILLDARLRSKGGYGDGFLTLPDTLSAGRYTLRAYTNWMRNFSEEWYFNKIITVVRIGPAPAPGPIVPPKLDVQFLPEGGQLVTGLPSRVALKAVSTGGVGADVEGFVLNARQDTVAGFKTQHLGMGTFPFTPEAGQTYLAYLRTTGSTDGFTSYTLPAAASTGYVMQVENLGNKDNIRVFVSNNLPVSPASADSTTAAPKLTVLALVNGQPIHAVQGPVSRKSFMVPIPRAKCPEGIVQLTLLDPAGKPVCERLVYVSRNDLLTLTVKPRAPTTGPRKRVDLDITATDAAGQPVAAGLSLAVTDAKQTAPAKPYGPTLPAYLLLTSDLTGYIEQPGYYFDPANTDRLAKLDLLLLTQGWRRIRWEKVLADVLPPTRFFLDPDLTLAGTVFRATSRMPAPAVPLTVMMMGKDSAQRIFTANSDAEGRFYISNANLVDTVTVFVQASQGTNRNFNVVLDKLYSPQVRLVRPPLMPSEMAYADLAEFLKRQGEYAAIEAQIRRNREIQLQAVVVTAKRADPFARQRAMYGTPDVSLKVDETMLAGANTVLDLIRARVAGVQVNGYGNDATITIRGSAPIIQVDGMTIDVQGINSFNPRDVAMIDVIKGPGASIMGGSSAINIITRRGGQGGPAPASNVPAPGVLVEKVVGFTPVREFYAPRYDAPTPEERVRPDYRATLLWAPAIRTNAAGKATVSFYTSDAKTTLRMVLEGASRTGQPGHTNVMMTVN